MWTRVDLKMRGKQAFKRNYWSCVLVAFIMAFIVSAGASSGANEVKNANGDSDYTSVATNVTAGQGLIFAAVMGVVAIIALASVVFGIFIGNVLLVGGSRFFVQNQTGTPGVGTMMHVFKSGHYVNVVLTMFLRGLFISLWTLLLIVPGIIKYYEYLMIPYILAENPGMAREEAFTISKKMMMGQKWNTFVLELSFIGWWILTALTCGVVGVLYVQPYREATLAELYTANKAMAYNNGFIR